MINSQYSIQGLDVEPFQRFFSMPEAELPAAPHRSHDG